VAGEGLGVINAIKDDLMSNYEVLWQMSLSEKAAILYLLGKLDNHSVALEIGSYKGGLLHVLSQHFDKVYSLDIDHSTIIDKEQYGNVVWIEGDSKETLLPLIQEINASGEDVGFILVDGDHSYDTVVQDIDNILSYVPQGETLLLVHDSWYKETRDAINKSNWSVCPYVVMVEKDFVPGDMIGSDEGNLFIGGLALVFMSTAQRHRDIKIGQAQDYMYRICKQLLDDSHIEHDAGERPKIVIGCPIRNRAWALPKYLKALLDLDYSNKVFLYLENDSNDSTLPILQEFATNEWLAQVFSESFAGPGHSRGEYNQDGYAHLAALRNRFLDFFLETDGNYLLSIDSDVIPPPETVKRLLGLMDGKTIAGAALCNVAGQKLDGHTPGNFMIEQDGQIVHPDPYPLSGVMDVAVIGACYMIPRQAIMDGVRYSANPQGEDIPWCLSAKEKGYSVKVVLDLVCDHRMIEPNS
jgi:hypothetical protein